MKKTLFVGSLACLFPLLALVASGQEGPAEPDRQAVAQLDRAVAQAEVEKQAPAKPARKEPRGRLPNYYAKAGVNEAQREQIYGIQAKYQGQLAALQQQMRELVAKRDQEIQGVLTEEQRAELKKLEDEAAKQRAEAAAQRKAAAGKKAAPEQP
ncbi:MAG: hypothetical protein WED34_18980 [Planctomycetales bacterium]